MTVKGHPPFNIYGCNTMSGFMSYYTKEVSFKLTKCTKDKNPIKFTKEKV